MTVMGHTIWSKFEITKQMFNHVISIATLNFEVMVDYRSSARIVTFQIYSTEFMIVDLCGHIMCWNSP